jgi:uncharacterized phage infection (PIP) family protein YhgE
VCARGAGLTGRGQAKVGLTHTKEISNAINEANDVYKSYQTVAKQSAEAAHYLTKWGVASENANLAAAFALTQTQAEASKAAFMLLLDVMLNDYLKPLTELQKQTELVAKGQEKVEALEKKVKAGKAQQPELDAAQQQYQADSTRVHHDTEVAYKRAATALTTAFIRFHESQLAEYRKVLTGLQNAPAAASAPAPAVTQQPPAQQPPAQQPPAQQPPQDDDDDELPPGPIGMVGSSAPPTEDEGPPPYNP